MSVPEPRWPGVPQLRMRRPILDDLPPVAVAPPYRLRTYRSGDEAAWVEIMREGIGPSWSLDKWRTEILARPQWDPASMFMAVVGERVAGSACGWALSPSERDVGYIHMVAASPEHRGHKLGYWLTLRVLHRFRELGMREALLDTEDYRLPAIELYSRLRFEPLIRHATHGERWRGILRELGRSSRD